jgi:hypothetical protein
MKIQQIFPVRSLLHLQIQDFSCFFFLVFFSYQETAKESARGNLSQETLLIQHDFFYYYVTLSLTIVA